MSLNFLHNLAVQRARELKADEEAEKSQKMTDLMKYSKCIEEQVQYEYNMLKKRAYDGKLMSEYVGFSRCDPTHLITLQNRHDVITSVIKKVISDQTIPPGVTMIRTPEPEDFLPQYGSKPNRTLNYIGMRFVWGCSSENLGNGNNGNKDNNDDDIERKMKML